MSYAVLEVNLDAVAYCRDDNCVLGRKIFNPFRKHYKTHLHHDICENCTFAHLHDYLGEAAWQACLNLSAEIQAVRRNY